MPVHRRVLDDERGRCAGLPASRQALGHTKQDQQDGGEQANGRIAGKHPDAGSGQRHHDDHQHEHLTAAAAIAAAAEQEGTHGPKMNAVENTAKAANRLASRPALGK
jgi:hypothetical protein